MADAERDLVELRREIVEARNQAIKTDNQVKNLSIDIKGFERRFDGLERRTRISGLGTHVIVALTIVLASYMVQSVRVRSVSQDLQKSIIEAEAAKQSAEQSAEAARTRLAAVEQERGRHEKAAAIAAKLAEHLDAKREREAVDLLGSLELASLTNLEMRLLEKRIGDLRSRTAEAAYKNGKLLQGQNRYEASVAEMRKCLAIEPEGRYASMARYLIATQLWNLKRYEDAEPVLREILKRDTDRGVLDESRYLLGTALVGLGRRDEAKTVFVDIQQKGGRYATNARDQLAMLDAGGQAAAKPAAPVVPARKPDPVPAPVVPAAPAAAATSAAKPPPAPAAATRAPVPAPAPAPAGKPQAAAPAPAPAGPGR